MMNYDSTLQRIPTGSFTFPDHAPAQPINRSWRSRMIPKDRWAKFAIVWTTSQLVIVFLAECAIAKIHSDYRKTLESSAIDAEVKRELIPNVSALTIYHVLFIFAQFFQWILAADAVYTSSMIQLVSTTLYNVALFGYSLMQFKQARDIGIKLGLDNPLSTHPTLVPEIIVIIAMSIFALGWVLISQRLYRVFGWSIFKSLGADITVRNRLKMYHIYMMLLKLDVFFFLGFDIQYLVLVLLNNEDESLRWTHGLIAIPFTFILLILAYFAIRRENNIFMTLTLLGLSGGIGYLISKLVDVIKNGDSPKYSGSRNSLTFFEAITLALSIATFFVGIINFRNFGKGLKEQLNKAKGQSLELDNMPNSATAKDSTRWTLD
ncbi:hypothetical protein DFS34DRAFT_306313 [Phlyctochytrium arcticum]|nr:hypothetical protein DFS34DRAFT_306313 [Phlyctochytrium arcticum]